MTPYYVYKLSIYSDRSVLSKSQNWPAKPEMKYWSLLKIFAETHHCLACYLGIN